MTHPPSAPSPEDRSDGGVLAAVQNGAALVGKGIEGLAFAIGAVLLLILSAILFAQVVFRYVIEQPLSWAEEAARFMLVWLAMLAAVIAARRGLHFVFRWGTIWLPPRARSVLRLLVNALTVVIIGVIFVHSLDYFALMSNQRTQATNVNMQVPVGGIVVGVFLIGAVYFLECVDQLLGFFTGRSSSYLEEEDARAVAMISDEGT